jgi:hypothetical protein
MQSFTLPKDLNPEDVQLVDLLNAACKTLGLKPVIENGLLSGSRHDEMMVKLKEVVAVEEKVKETEYQLRSLGMQMRREGEAALTVEQVYERLPEFIERAKLADGQVNQLRSLALKWFDSANVDPSKKDSLTDNQKKMRARLEASTDLDFIEEQLQLYEQMTRKRFEVLGQKAPDIKMTKHVPKQANDPLKSAEIADSCKKIYKRGDK